MENNVISDNNSPKVPCDAPVDSSNSIEQIDGNLKIIRAEFQKLKGQFIITDSWQIERLVAIGEDGFDYYYVTYNGRELRFNTCVGRIIQLKGRIEEDDYNSFIRIAELNHYDQIKLFNIGDTEERRMQIQQHRAELMALKGKDKFLTEVFWDIV